MIATEQIEAMIAGLEGVTPGPWQAQETDIDDDPHADIDWGVSIIGVLRNEDGSLIETPTNGIVTYVPMLATEIFDHDASRVEKIAAHIARCDPDTMRSILTELLERRASGQVEVKPLDYFTGSVDAWGAAQWFERLEKAVNDQDQAVVQGDEISAETFRMIAASSAMRLVRDFAPVVRAALSAAPQPQSAGVTDELSKAKAEAIDLLLTASDIWEDYGSGFRIHFSFDAGTDMKVVERVHTAQALSHQGEQGDGT